MRNNLDILKSVIFYVFLLAFIFNLPIHSEAGIAPLGAINSYQLVKNGTKQDEQISDFKDEGINIEFVKLQQSSNTSIMWQKLTKFNDTHSPNVMLLKTIVDDETKPSQIKIRIYGEGTEHRFPPFLEWIIQRIQNYFSVYKYTDTSRPPFSATTVAVLTPTIDSELRNGSKAIIPATIHTIIQIAAPEISNKRYHKYESIDGKNEFETDEKDRTRPSKITSP